MSAPVEAKLRTDKIAMKRRWRAKAETTTRVIFVDGGNDDRMYNLTCIPHTRTPSDLLVVRSHFFLWLFFLAVIASMPYCRVPIFKSSTQERFKRPVRSSIRMKCVWRVTDGSDVAVVVLLQASSPGEPPAVASSDIDRLVPSVRERESK